MRPVVAPAALALFLVGMAPGSWIDSSHSTTRTVTVTTAVPCTHGASSIGPIQLSHGHVVGPIPKAHTEPCLP